MHVIRLSLLTAFLFSLVCLCPVELYAGQQSGGYQSGDGIEGNVEDGDTQGSLDALIAWWKTNSGIEMGDHDARMGECKEVVGFLFDFGNSWDMGDGRREGRQTDDNEIFYCAIDKSGQKIVLEDPSGGTVTDLYWSFQATVSYDCVTPSSMTLTPDPASIEIGEQSTVTIQLDCHEAGGVGGMTVNLWLEPDSPGELDQHEVTTDGSGQATVNFTADNEGTAIVKAQILSCSSGENTATLDAECSIDVGGNKLRVDLIYIGETHEGVEFFSSFVLRMDIDLEEAGGIVSGTGEGRTTFDFEYHNEEVHTDNWSESGFTACTAEGTFVDDTYLININTTGNISYEHVVQVPGSEPIRIPIEAPIDWDQLLAEPIVITSDPDDTFSTNGSFPWGLTYTIAAKWVSEGEQE